MIHQTENYKNAVEKLKELADRFIVVKSWGVPGHVPTVRRGGEGCIVQASEKPAELPQGMVDEMTHCLTTLCQETGASLSLVPREEK